MQGAGNKWNSPSEKWNSPSPPCFARSLPPRGSREEADNFCRKKMKALNFFQTRGRHAKSSSVGRSRQLPRRGSRERGLSIKRLFDEKMPDCCLVAPHSSKASLCPPSPRGEGLERGRNLNRPLSSACADTFPATVGFFALFSLRRKSEKGESKDKAADARHFPRRGKQGGGSAPMGKARGVSTL